ncbi:hypothetical protein ACQKMV_23200 [Lysinibacillus sp. NPDC094403]|uniref:hypothetical protein n=1 Tax=Lysinibacillus sp. NPDC094403 TaxID=3390581 RepID=UPI003D04B5EE
MIILSVNELIVDIDLGNTYRVLWIDSGYVIAYVIDINDKNALPFRMNIKEINEKVAR